MPNGHHCLLQLEHELEEGEITSLALPRIATGVGGREWSAVKPLVHERRGGLKIPVLVSTEDHKGLQAQEPGR